MVCTPGKENRHRADRIRKTMMLVPEYDIETEVDAAVIDVLTDLRHLCDVKGWSFGDLDAMAHQHYLEELGGSDGTTN